MSRVPMSRVPMSRVPMSRVPMSRVAVAGGTGLVGRLVVAALRERGHEVVVLARAAGVDLVEGTGLDAALAGVTEVVDVSNTAATGRTASVAFFDAATRNLLAAGRRAGVRHLVVLSIVGIDRVPLGYYAGKHRQEELALAGSSSGPGATVLRATQFHEFADQLLARQPLGGRLPVVPRMRVQPVAAREVAAALADLVPAVPAGRVPDLAGPREEQLVDLVRRVLRARGSHRPVLGVRVPGRAGRAAAGGGLLPEGPGPRGVQTFSQFLAGARLLEGEPADPDGARAAQP